MTDRTWAGSFTSALCLIWQLGVAVFDILYVDRYASSGPLVSCPSDRYRRAKKSQEMSWAVCRVCVREDENFDEPESLILAQSERWRHA